MRYMTLEFQKIEDVLEAIKAAEKLQLYYSLEKKYEGPFYEDVWSLKIECWCEGSSEDERVDQGVQD